VIHVGELFEEIVDKLFIWKGVRFSNFRRFCGAVVEEIVVEIDDEVWFEDRGLRDEDVGSSYKEAFLTFKNWQVF